MLPSEAERENSLFGVEISLYRTQGQQPCAVLCPSAQPNSLGPASLTRQRKSSLWYRICIF